MERSLVGLSVRLVLDQRPLGAASEYAPVSVEGIVFAYDARLNLVVLCSPVSVAEDQFDVHVLRASHVLEVHVLEDASTPSRKVLQSFLGGGVPLSSGVSLPRLDLESLRHREARSIQRAQERLEKLGRGVSAHAQLVFDALDKTLPCHWEGPNIVVLDSVCVAPPYTVDAVRAIDGDQAAAQRVCLVLERELSRPKVAGQDEEHSTHA
ncbi:protein with role in RNA processing [Cyanidiococcus yangmingshanensis]|uniref:Protein with role in RNA processing n=1 Tax=Cyanidiococcus yangmingshanensis TaxID=2690220 RepID=A0A7J7IJ24_9RHOD|nr:protein with role in RNA processing [Cyanidiococcus yangmingshanensis]